MENKHLILAAVLAGAGFLLWRNMSEAGAAELDVKEGNSLRAQYERSKISDGKMYQSRLVVLAELEAKGDAKGAERMRGQAATYQKRMNQSYEDWLYSRAIGFGRGSHRPAMAAQAELDRLGIDWKAKQAAIRAAMTPEEQKAADAEKWKIMISS
tara:strand:+ start:5527 stop:5991 length:465 start_codon:yes stop_codon:yes gene_type:complete